MLSSGDAAYARDVFKTCCTTGFFLLDMGGDKVGDDMIQQIEAMFNISNSTFDLDLEEKIKYSQDIPNDQFNGCVKPPIVSCNLDLFHWHLIVQPANRD